MSVNEKLDLILERFAALDSKVEEMHREIQKTNAHISSVQVEITDIKTENSHLKNQIQAMQKRIDSTENATRKNNIIIKGIDEHEHEDLTEIVTELIPRKLNIQLKQEDIQDIFRMNTRSSPKPILLRLTRYMKKNEIMREKVKLNGSKIYLDNDYNETWREIRRKLLPFMHEARKEGKRSSIIKNMLKIDDDLFTLNEEQTNIIHSGMQVKGRKRDSISQINLAHNDVEIRGRMNDQVQEINDQKNNEQKKDGIQDNHSEKNGTLDGYLLRSSNKAVKNLKN